MTDRSGAQQVRRGPLGRAAGWFGDLARPVRITLLVLVVAALAALVWFVLVPLLRSCDSGLTSIGDGQCVGVSDGSARLSAEGDGVVTVDDVLAKIRDENAGLPDSAVTVAIVVALPRPGTDASYRTTLMHDIEGAHAAQVAANRTPLFGGERPPVRLLVVNTGDAGTGDPDSTDGGTAGGEGTSTQDRQEAEQTQQDREKQIVGEVVDRNGAGRQLVSAIVTGRSIASTGRVIDLLLGARVPVVAARLTGDTLGTPPPPSTPLSGRLVRVAPSNRAQAAAVADVLRQQTTTALVVQDRAANDDYVASLGSSFTDRFTGEGHVVLGGGDEDSYDSSRGGVESKMTRIASSICDENPGVVFLAGRTDALRALVEALASRKCAPRPIRVVSGPDAAPFATAVTQDPDLRRALASGVTVSFTSDANPGAWDDPRVAAGTFAQPSVDQLRAPCTPEARYRFACVFPGESLDDGAAIIGFDAVTSVVHVVRSGVPANETPGSVAQNLSVTGQDPVPGASGRISWGPDGEAVGKPVPIVTVGPDSRVHYDGLAGTP